MPKKEIDIPVEGIILNGDLTLPDKAKGVVIFSHGSGSSRKSPRNRYVAESLQQKGFATLLFDLLTPFEDSDSERRFDIDLLTRRLSSATLWLMKQSPYSSMNAGYFGASTGAASALRAAAELGPGKIRAVVSRGGRPDLVSDFLGRVFAPTLLVVGGRDKEVLKLNESAFKKLASTKRLSVIPGATHLFEEEGKLEEVTRQASEWFLKYLYRNTIEIEKDFIN